MIIYETRTLVKILRRIHQNESLPVKPLIEKYYFFTNDYVEELVKQQYVRKGRIENKKFTDKSNTPSKGFDSESYNIALAQRGEYVVDCYWKSVWRIVLEIVLCLLSAVIGGLVAYFIS